MPLRFLAVDLNSLFASCEQQERPELRGRPVGIVPVLAETTCCIAANYPAKAKGVKVGMGLAEARECCPDILFVKQRPALNISYHHRLLEVIESCGPSKRVGRQVPLRAGTTRVATVTKAGTGTCPPTMRPT